MVYNYDPDGSVGKRVHRTLLSSQDPTNAQRRPLKLVLDDLASIERGLTVQSTEPPGSPSRDDCGVKVSHAYSATMETFETRMGTAKVYGEGPRSSLLRGPVTQGTPSALQTAPSDGQLGDLTAQYLDLTQKRASRLKKIPDSKSSFNWTAKKFFIPMCKKYSIGRNIEPEFRKPSRIEAQTAEDLPRGSGEDIKYLSGSFLQYDTLGDRLTDLSKNVMVETRKMITGVRQNTGINFGIHRRPQWNHSTNSASKSQRQVHLWPQDQAAAAG